MVATAFVTDLTAWLLLASSCVSVMTAVGLTCRKVWRWVDRQEDRSAAVDVVIADWAERGITPAGAVAEAKRYRDVTDANTSAIASHKARLDDVDDQLEHIDTWRLVVSARLDDLSQEVRRGLE